jgi:hypothetical protein
VGAHDVKELDLPGVGVHAGSSLRESWRSGNFISKQKETDKGKQVDKTITKEEK